MPDETAPRRSSGGTFLLFALVFCASVIGALWHVLRKPAAVVDTAGFDLAEVARGEAGGDAGPAPAAAPKSGLGMIAAIKGIRFGQAEQKGAGASATPAASATSLRELIKATERRVINLAVDYTRRYPVIRQYGDEWMNHPDLRKLNDDYMRTHDPFAFMKGLASAPSFGKMVKKYAAEPAMRSFVLDVMKNAPPEAMPTAVDYVTRNDEVKKLTDSVAVSLGLPPAVLEGAQAPKVDGGKIAEQIQRAGAAP